MEKGSNKHSEHPELPKESNESPPRVKHDLVFADMNLAPLTKEIESLGDTTNYPNVLRAAELLREGKLTDAIDFIERCNNSTEVKAIIELELLGPLVRGYVKQQPDYHDAVDSLKLMEQLDDDQQRELRGWEQQKEAEFYKQHPEAKLFHDYAVGGGTYELSASEAREALAEYEQKEAWYASVEKPTLHITEKKALARINLDALEAKKKRAEQAESGLATVYDVAINVATLLKKGDLRGAFDGIVHAEEMGAVKYNVLNGVVLGLRESFYKQRGVEAGDGGYDEYLKRRDKADEAFREQYPNVVKIEGFLFHDDQTKEELDAIRESLPQGRESLLNRAKKVGGSILRFFDLHSESWEKQHKPLETETKTEQAERDATTPGWIQRAKSAMTGAAGRFVVTEESDRRTREQQQVGAEATSIAGELDGKGDGTSLRSRIGALKERFIDPETGKLYNYNAFLGWAALSASERLREAITKAGQRGEKAEVDNLLEESRNRKIGRAVTLAALTGVAAVGVMRGLDIDGMSDILSFMPDFSGFGGEAPAVDQSPTPETSPSPEVAEPTPEPTTEAEGPERPLSVDELLERHGADADAARTIEAGEGVDNTLREMGIEDAGLRQELATDPELRDTLVDRGVAYEAGDTIGWNEAGELDNQTIEDIYERAAELSGEEITATPETQETPEEVPLNEVPEPPSEIERAQAEAFTDALDTLEANSAETFESLNIPQGGSGEQLLQAINREFWPNGVMAIDQSAWYGIEDQLARDYPQDFYRMADGHVGLMRPGYISEQAKNGLVEILRARGYVNLVG